MRRFLPPGLGALIFGCAEPEPSVALDHFVLTVANVDRTTAFYERVLGMEHVRYGDGRHALRFGDAKINLHPRGEMILPRARRPTEGSADLCFRVTRSLEEVQRELERLGVAIEEGPVARTGARERLRSIYMRDPDGNLIEIANETPSR